MKLMITVPWGRRLGGAETMLFGFLRCVDRDRVDVEVVFFEDGWFVEEVALLGLRTHVLTAGRLRQLRSGVAVVRALARLLEQERPDLLLNWMPKTHLYGAAAAVLARRADRVVWWQHTVPRPDWLDRLATLLPTRAIGCSSNRSAAAQSMLRPARRVFVVHPGVEVPVLSSDADRRALRDELAIPRGRSLVGMVGRLEPGKRHDRFLDVVNALRVRGLDVHGLMVGGPLPGSSRDAVSSLGNEVRRRSLTDVVTLTGPVADARPLIELMDVVVSVASVEAFGIALVEAMAFGIPVVAIAAGGPEEIIESGASGILVPPNVDEIADAVQRILTDDRLRRRLSTGARGRFLSTFTAPRMARDIEAAMAELCAT